MLHVFQKKTQQTAKRDWTSLQLDYGKFNGGVTMKRQNFSNVWDALENTPAEAANETLTSSLSSREPRIADTPHRADL